MQNRLGSNSPALGGHGPLPQTTDGYRWKAQPEFWVLGGCSEHSTSLPLPLKTTIILHRMFQNTTEQGVSSPFFPSSISWLELNTVRNPEPGTVVHAHRNPQNPLVLAQSKQELMPRQSGRNSPGLFLSTFFIFSYPNQQATSDGGGGSSSKSSCPGKRKESEMGKKGPLQSVRLAAAPRRTPFIFSPPSIFLPWWRNCRSGQFLARGQKRCVQSNQKVSGH